MSTGKFFHRARNSERFVYTDGKYFGRDINAKSCYRIGDLIFVRNLVGFVH